LGLELLADEVLFLRQVRNLLLLGSSNENRRNHIWAAAEEFASPVVVWAPFGSSVLPPLPSAEVDGVTKGFFLAADLRRPCISGEAADPVESMVDGDSRCLKPLAPTPPASRGCKSSWGSSLMLFFFWNHRRQLAFSILAPSFKIPLVLLIICKSRGEEEESEISVCGERLIVDMENQGTKVQSNGNMDKT